MIRAFRRFSFGCVVLAAIIAAPQAIVNAAGQRVVHHRDRLDATLRGIVDQSGPKPQRVIIRVRPGSRLTLRQGLTAHGDQILAEHDSVDALTAVVHGEDLGPVGPHAVQGSLADFQLPQRGICVVAQGRFEAFDVARHRDGDRLELSA